MLSARSSRPFIVGNWKMNGSLAALDELDAIDAAARRARHVDVGICLPFPYLKLGRDRVSHLRIGAQNCHVAPHGAFTGQVSANMLADCGAQFVLLGHSECRSAGEQNATVAGKVRAALAADLDVIVCVGETSAGTISQAALRVERQLEAIVSNVPPLARLRIAYEPVWAIGSGCQPSIEHIVGVTSQIGSQFSRSCGQMPQTLYGGSVTSHNALALIRLPQVDGLLIGGASLVASTLAPIIRQADVSMY